MRQVSVLEMEQKQRNIVETGQMITELVENNLELRKEEMEMRKKIREQGEREDGENMWDQYIAECRYWEEEKSRCLPRLAENSGKGRFSPADRRSQN